LLAVLVVALTAVAVLVLVDFVAQLAQLVAVDHLKLLLHF
jgi:hypothetical protein